MKKTLISILVIGILLIVAYLSYDHLFPYARPLEEVLDTTKIQLITISTSENTNQQNTVPEADTIEIISLINAAKPTRKMTLNETPAVSAYYIMEIQIENRVRKCYVYEENGKTYLDFPYEGVYRINKQINDIISGI